MKTRQLFTLTLGVAMAVAPLAAFGQSHSVKHRQDTKNQWKNIGLVSAGAGLLGLLSHNNTLTVLGAAGAAYAGTRYEQDRKSQRRLEDRYGYNDDRYYNGDRYNDRNSGYDRYDNRDRYDGRYEGYSASNNRYGSNDRCDSNRNHQKRRKNNSHDREYAYNRDR